MANLENLADVRFVTRMGCLMHKPQRIMALVMSRVLNLLFYTLTERKLREELAKQEVTGPDARPRCGASLPQRCSSAVQPDASVPASDSAGSAASRYRRWAEPLDLRAVHSWRPRVGVARPREAAMGLREQGEVERFDSGEWALLHPLCA